MSDRPRRRLRRRGDDGAATLLVIVMSGVLMTVAFGVAGVIGLVHAHRVAQAAADLSALAGAEVSLRGGDGCARATELAAANGAELVACRATPAWIEVEVVVPPPAVLGVTDDLRAGARAGPEPG